MTIRREMPSSFSAGETVSYRRSFADYPTSDDWALTVYLRGKSILDATAEVVDGEFEITLTAEETAAVQPGTYQWFERVSRTVGDTAEVHNVAAGVANVEMDLAQAGPGEAQFKAEQDLEVIDARLHERLTKDMESYRIAGREVMNIPIKELREEQARLIAVLNRLRYPDRVSRSVGLRFTRPS